MNPVGLAVDTDGLPFISYDRFLALNVWLYEVCTYVRSVVCFSVQTASCIVALYRLAAPFLFGFLEMGVRVEVAWSVSRG